MAQVFNENLVSQDEISDISSEHSKIEEQNQIDGKSSANESSSNSNKESSDGSNIIKLNADGTIIEKDENSQDSNMDEEHNNNSSQDRDDYDDNESKENENSNDSSSGNVLRRSKRMAGNHNSYGYQRRSFKYDNEFEYTGNIGQKRGAIDMEPPEQGSQGKRKRKSTTLNTLAYNDGAERYSINSQCYFRHSSKSGNQGNTHKVSYGSSQKDDHSRNSGGHSNHHNGENKIDKSITYNQGRWTSYEHFKFLEALKIYGKEWQKVQQHVNTRTSTQARSHAQKFFVKLDKKNLTLEEFLKDLDLKEVEKTLLAAGHDNTDYDEEREVNMIANKKLHGSVMNIALPTDLEDKKQLDSNVPMKRSRSEVDAFSSNNIRNKLITTKEQIMKNFEQYNNEENEKQKESNTFKRMKTSDKSEFPEEKPNSDITAVTHAAQNSQDNKDLPFRKLSISNFEPIQSKSMSFQARKIAHG